jgi:hypothetical protein
MVMMMIMVMMVIDNNNIYSSVGREFVKLLVSEWMKVLLLNFVP